MKCLDIPPEVATGVAVLAACIGAPMTTKRSQLATADYDFVASLQLTMALLTVFVTPAILSVFYWQFDIAIEPVPPAKVAAQVALVTFLPVVIGQVLKTTVPNLVLRFREPLGKLSDIMFLILMVSAFAAIVVVPALREKLLLGGSGVTALLVMAAGAVVMGHLAGGSKRNMESGFGHPDTRP